MLKCLSRPKPLSTRSLVGEYEDSLVDYLEAKDRMHIANQNMLETMKTVSASSLVGFLYMPLEIFNHFIEDEELKKSPNYACYLGVYRFLKHAPEIQYSNFDYSATVYHGVDEDSLDEYYTIVLQATSDDSGFSTYLQSRRYFYGYRVLVSRDGNRVTSGFVGDSCFDNTSLDDSLRKPKFGKTMFGDSYMYGNFIIVDRRSANCHWEKIDEAATEGFVGFGDISEHKSEAI